MLRDWGQDGSGRHGEQGFNYRMDGMQGRARVKLRHLDSWNAARRRNAAAYDIAPAPVEGWKAPDLMPWAEHVYHIYAVRTADRAAVQQQFEQCGVETRVHYPLPIHLSKRGCISATATAISHKRSEPARKVLSIQFTPSSTLSR